MHKYFWNVYIEVLQVFKTEQANEYPQAKIQVDYTYEIRILPELAVVWWKNNTSLSIAWLWIMFRIWYFSFPWSTIKKQ